MKGSECEIYGNQKQNLTRIGQKIEEDKTPFRITDMVRATVQVNDISQV